MMAFEREYMISHPLDDLEREQRECDRLAEMLGLALRFMADDSRHVVAIPGSDVPIGMIIEGALARHERRRQVEAP